MLGGRTTGVGGRVAGLVGWPAGELGGADAGGATWVGAGGTVGSPVALGPCGEPAPEAGRVVAGPVGAGPVGVVELAVGWAGSVVDAGCWRSERTAARPASAAADGGSQCS
jgi:hypothetical protein